MHSILRPGNYYRVTIDGRKSRSIKFAVNRGLIELQILTKLYFSTLSGPSILRGRHHPSVMAVVVGGRTGNIVSHNAHH